MKNETTRTKTLSGFSYRAIALVLCFVMLLTAIGSGSVLSAIAADFEGNGAAVLVDAAKAGASVDVAADVAAADDKVAADEDEAPLTKKADTDLADVGADKELADTGAKMDYPYVYFDGSDKSWSTTVYFWVGNGDYCKRYTMEKVDNSDYLWYVAPGDKWENDANYYAFVWGYDNLGTGDYNGDLWQVLDQVDNTNNKTGQRAGYALNYHESYTFKRASTWSNAPDVTTGVTKSQTVNVYTDGSHVGTGGTVSISAYYPSYTSKSTTNSTTSTTTSSPDVTYDSATIRTNTTYTATAEPGYKFVGFYSSTSSTTRLDTKTSDTSGTYTHRVTYSDNSYKIYARFEKDSSTPVTTTGWIFSKDGSAFNPTTSFNQSAGNYRIIWSPDSNAVGTQNKTVTPTSDGGHGYWADLTSSIGSNQNFYFALSNNSDNSGIRGNKSEEINDSQPSGNYTDVTIKNGSDTLFKLQRCDNTTVSNNAAFILIYDIDWTKVAKIGVVAYDNTNGSGGTNSGNVDYRIYYQLITASDKKYVTVYAKDGAAPINWDNKTQGGADAISNGTKYNYAAIATTTITQINGATPASGVVSTNDVGDSSSQYRQATVEAGQTVTIQTKISSSYSSKYYIKGWCVNGVTYKSGADSTGVNANSVSDTESFTYTIPEDFDLDYLEVTPIYYIKASGVTCITFTLEGYDDNLMTKGGWGNTPYIYPFYGNLDNVKNSFGVYPGQPMVYTGGEYSCEIPITSYAISSTADNGTAIKGITISNGYADHVHKNLVYGWSAADNDAAHKQTYDYDDFYKIYNEKTYNNNGIDKPNAIIFRIKDESNTYNRKVYGASYTGARVTSTTSLTSDDLNTINSGNGWELLTNRQGKPIDLFGSVVTAPATAATVVDANALRVISTGYNANIAGDYGTAWKVYAYNSSNFALQYDANNSRYAIPPSVLLLRGTSSGYDSAVANVRYPDADHYVVGPGSYTDSISKYEGLYKKLKTSYSGKPVYITYEKNTQDTRDDTSGTGAYRVDGRWFYTFAPESVQAEMRIEYWDKATQKWVDETPTSGTAGTKSGSSAEFTDSHKLTSNSYYINSNKTFDFTATAGSKYTFDSWQIKYDDTYQPIVGATAAAGSTPANAKKIIVARFEPTETGDLTITHKLDPASTGEGTVGITAVVKNGSDTLREYNGSVNDGVATVYIPSADSFISNNNLDYTVNVTLTNTPSYDGKVTEFGYDSKVSVTPTTTPDPLPGSAGSAATSAFNFTVGSLFTGGGNSQSVDTLAYTSTVSSSDHYYNFTYTFNDRDGSEKTYTAKGILNLKDYKTYVTDDHVMSKSFVIAKAPFESNFMKINSLPESAVDISTGENGYDSTTMTFKAAATYSESADIPTFDVLIKLPYDYHDSKSGTAYKKYTATDSATYMANKPAVSLTAQYNTFVTGDGTQNNVQKVVSADDPKHTGNNFITAPDQLGDMYFSYWRIMKLEKYKDGMTDTEKANATVAKVYYPDFNYRIYGNYYVEAVFSDKAADSWKMNYFENSNNIGCSIMYLGDSRNQWNMQNSTTTSSASSDVAADKIYSDFIFNYAYKGAELKGSSDVQIGMVVERVIDTKANKWATGSTAVTDMDSYRTAKMSDNSTTYGSQEADKKAAIKSWLEGGSKVTGCVQYDYDTSELQNKNFLEKNFYAYSAYGQTVTDTSITFATDSAMDEYIYRAYAVMKDKSANTWYVSDPAYFCMRYTANRKGLSD